MLFEIKKNTVYLTIILSSIIGFIFDYEKRACTSFGYLEDGSFIILYNYTSILVPMLLTILTTKCFVLR